MKVYWIDQLWGDGYFAFHSKEFGWFEYYDNYDMYSPLTFKDFKDAMIQTVNQPTKNLKEKFIKENVKKVYLGIL